jgi:GTPase SAR1 family protein
MGGYIAGVWNTLNRLFTSKKNFKILILGLANAGKTTILYQLYYVIHVEILEKSFRLNQQSAAMSKKLSTETSSFKYGM